MKRDMELCRKILFAIEEQYKDTALRNLKVEGYTMEEVAYHCKILHDANLISDYKGFYGSNHLYSFRVGPLTWAGCDYLDKIREDTIWNRTKEAIKKNGLTLTIDVISQVSSAIISAAAEGAVKGFIAANAKG